MKNNRIRGSKTVATPRLATYGFGVRKRAKRESKEEVIRVRCTPEFKKEVEDFARNVEEESLSVFARKALREYMRRHKEARGISNDLLSDAQKKL